MTAYASRCHNSTCGAQASTSGRDRVPDGARNRINSTHSRSLERHLQPVFPSETFPFAVRLSIDLLAAGGSETMMALAAASLAMTDAGIPIHSQIAGVWHMLVMHVQVHVRLPMVGCVCVHLMLAYFTCL